MKFKLQGWASARKTILKLKGEMPDKIMNALAEEGKIELKEMKKRTPVRTGELQKSLVMTGPHRDGRRIWIEFVTPVPYALFVHEDLEAFHANGQAKFIESVLQESRPFMADRIAKRLKK